MNPTDKELRRILDRTRVIACVGFSTNPVRPSHYVARYLSLRGYRVIPINPGHAGELFLGETVVASVADAPPETDMIDIFRRSDQVLPIVEAAIKALPRLATVWMQIGVRNEAAAELARSRGLDVVQNRCPKMEHQRLHGELRKAGFATGMISSRL